jgi:hypothetical protein
MLLLFYCFVYLIKMQFACKFKRGPAWAGLLRNCHSERSAAELKNLLWFIAIFAILQKT